MATATTTTKSVAKKNPPPKKRSAKSNGAGKAKTSNAKKKATAKKAPAEKVVAKTDKLAEDKINEDSVKAKVEQINKLVADSEQSRTKNDWKIGKLLLWIRERVTDGTWGKVCTDYIEGIGGRKLGKSSVDKKMKLFKTFPENEELAVSIGVGRLDQICRLPTQAEREAVLEGIKYKGEEVQVQDLKVRELSEAIDEYMELAHPKAVKTPQEVFVKAVKSLAKKCQSVLDEHSSTIADREFEKEDIATLKASVKQIKTFLGSLKINPAGAKQAA